MNNGFLKEKIFDANGFIDMEKAINNVYQGDCMTFMNKMADKSIDFVLTDIPYDGVNRESNGLRVFDKGHADEITFPLDKFVDELYRLSTKGGVVFCGFEQLSFIHEFFKNKKNCETRTLYWRKNNPSPVNAENVYLSALETAVWFQFDNIQKPWKKNNRSSLLRYNCGTSKDHPTEKNSQLLKDILRLNINACNPADNYPGDIVFDPCSGSGSHLLSAMNLACRFIGCELDEKFFKIACDKIRTGHYGNDLCPNYSKETKIPAQTKHVIQVSVQNNIVESSEKEENNIFNGDPIKYMKSMRENSVSFTITDVASYLKEGRLNQHKNIINQADKLDIESFVNEIQRVTSKSMVVLCNLQNFSEIYGYFNQMDGSTRAIAWENDSPGFIEPNDYVYKDNMRIGVWFKKASAHKVLQNFFKSNVFCYDSDDQECFSTIPGEKNLPYKTYERFVAELILDNTENVLVKLSKKISEIKMDRQLKSEIQNAIKNSQSLNKFQENIDNINFAGFENIKQTIGNLIVTIGNETVFDPCCNDGTILKQAQKYGRKICGCESDNELFQQTIDNLNKKEEKQSVDTRNKRTKKEKLKETDQRLTLF